jgi:hypothetical protein
MVTVGDFNNDSHLDIAVANFGTNNIGVFHGFGNESFATQKELSTGVSRPIAIIGGDFNNDTLLDMAVANYGNQSISIIYQYEPLHVSHERFVDKVLNRGLLIRFIYYG